MTHLERYIEQKNSWARIFGGDILNAKNLDHQAAQRLANSLCSDLSPENLTCDGELDRHTVQQRYQLYTGALKELQTRFSVTAEYY